uniref:Uncharacterized protein n=1 Tax=Anguilla anguilla TaxID=7936 RepID=A0A0E9RVC8_ANGAN
MATFFVLPLGKGRRPLNIKPDCSSRFKAGS